MTGAARAPVGSSGAQARLAVNGFGVFTGVTAVLFPLTVIKTRLIVQRESSASVAGALAAAQQVVRTDGYAGLYRGLGTVVAGTIPGRVLYLSTLEASKASALRALEPWELSDAARMGVASAASGCAASLASQAVVIPVDVVSQQQMVAGLDGRARAENGVATARRIVRAHGVWGLYRGFGASVLTFVPSSSIWWGAYGVYQQLWWHALPDRAQARLRDFERSGFRGTAPTELLGLQAVSGMCAGATSGALTTPLDVVKTRLQTHEGERRSFASVIRELHASEGLRGFTRGMVPRMANTALWGTCMVNAYELLKRWSVKDD